MIYENLLHSPPPSCSRVAVFSFQESAKSVQPADTTQKSDVCQQNNGGWGAGLRQHGSQRFAAFRNIFTYKIYGQESGFFYMFHSCFKAIDIQSSIHIICVMNHRR